MPGIELHVYSDAEGRGRKIIGAIIGVAKTMIQLEFKRGGDKDQFLAG